MRDLEITIAADGEIRCLAPDDLDLTELGPCHVRRASHVEFDNRRQAWITTLPNNTELGAYRTRGEALAAEVAFLNARIDNDTIEEVL